MRCWCGRKSWHTYFFGWNGWKKNCLCFFFYY